jgi:hypothetical protein
VSPVVPLRTWLSSALFNGGLLVCPACCQLGPYGL